MGHISVIIPAYNQAHYLAAAIQSILKQTYQDFEIIVVDDGSSDETHQVVSSVADKRISYIYQTNQGLSAARNTGILRASSPYLVFLDADDLLLPSALATHLEVLMAHPHASISVGGWIYADEQGEAISKAIAPEIPAVPSFLLLGNPFPVHSIMIARSALENTGIFDEELRACEDWDLWLRLAIAGHSIVCSTESVCMYRMHKGQMTRQPERMRTAMLKVLDKTFGNPHLPEAWHTLHDAAYAAAYLRAAARSYHAAKVDQARCDLAEATRLNPGYLEDNAKKLVNALIGWANAPLSGDPLVYLERVLNNLPNTLSFLRPQQRRLLARVAMDHGFEAYHHCNHAAVRSFILRAILYQPKCLLNRGVVSIFVRSCFRFQIGKRAKNRMPGSHCHSSDENSKVLNVTI